MEARLGYFPNFSFLLPPSPRVTTKWWSGAHQRTGKRSRQARSARTTFACVRVRPRSHAQYSAHGRDESEGLSPLKIPVATDFPQPLCRNREFSAAIEVSRSLITTELSCHDRVCCWAWVAWDFDRGFLYRDRALLALCRDHELCRDRAWSSPGGLVSRHCKCDVIVWRNGPTPAYATGT